MGVVLLQLRAPIRVGCMAAWFLESSEIKADSCLVLNPLALFIGLNTNVHSLTFGFPEVHPVSSVLVSAQCASLLDLI